ncbi:Vancomycin B-type resistance protein VanW [Enhygromyxa salina]|uniref:Vancomycin B-type resistance protein VanW n=1 Tax=Enhygromyxa salina TaxID=215803 RepID=A0A0C2DCI2_9BACT|nr:VanW family protein [Enhygromyxa salina]KIG17422.1 Vancomycin B-type resistance protein VanW [Enhygromyxa salina]
MTAQAALRITGAPAKVAGSPRASQTRGRTGARRSQRRTEADPGPSREPEPEPEPELTPQQRRRRGWWAVLAGAESITMLAAGVATAAVLAGAWESSQTSDRTVPGLLLAGDEIGGLGREEIEAIAAAAGERSLDRSMTLAAGSVTTTTTARALGAVPDPAAVVDQALDYGHSGDLIADLRARARARAGAADLRIGMRFDARDALAELLELAPAVDTMSVPTRLDLEARKVLPAARGTALLPYDSLSSVAIGLASGLDHIELAVAHKPPVADPLAAKLADVGLDGLDVGVVLGTFSTPYSMEASSADRTFNLKVGAAALDGHVLMPGERFSFNEVVGERSAENGYRWAPGISGGQIVDSVGGGICQIASTVFGAGFFAGLEVVHARPHSRPSGYVDMGLDATVVWDTIDLVLRNPFEFPVVIHMTVSQGQVHGEILGPQRPHQVAFERSLVEAKPYETVYRSDPRLRTGAEVVAQRGMRGFKIERVRKLYRGGAVETEESWELEYPATREIIRVGTDPNGEVPEQSSLPPLRDPAASMRIMQ